MPMRVATWNVFHGRSVPAERANLLPAFVAALASEPWDVCGLQEVPPWWAAALGRALGASVRVDRTSLLRSAFPGVQRAIHVRDPERLKSGGAGANMLLVRPSAGVIDKHRVAVLRRAPHRRIVQAVRLVRPHGRGIWIANVHAHNEPLAAAEADVARALAISGDWAAGARQPATGPAGVERVVLLGDLNVADPAPLSERAGFSVLHGHRVDFILGRGLRADGGAVARRFEARPGLGLSDHRFVAVDIADA